MTRRLPVLFVLSLFALPLFAAVQTQPAQPTSATPITLIVSGFGSCPPAPQVTRSGNTITVATGYGPCLSPPAPVTFTLPIGTLPPGDYEVVVMQDGNRSDYGMFFVSDASTQLIVQGPNFGPANGGTRVTLLPGDALTCTGTDLNLCPVPVVTFNGVPATVDVNLFKQGQLVVTTPPNTKGIANVVVVGSRRTVSGYVFRYYARDEAPPSSMFERVLLPVYFFARGAFGTNWTTDVEMLNASFFPIEPWLLDAVPPRTQTAVNLGGSRPGGALVFTPRDFASSIRFGARVRDGARESDDWGTEVPVIRESQFRSGEFSLLNIPLDSRFRLLLRVYGVDSVDDNVTIRATANDGTAAVRSFPLHSTTPCAFATPCVSIDPAFTSLDPLAAFPEMAGKSTMRLDMYTSRQRSWAFVTITNNATQHVTIVTPQ